MIVKRAFKELEAGVAARDIVVYEGNFLQSRNFGFDRLKINDERSLSDTLKNVKKH